MVVPYFHGAWAYGGIPRLAHGLARSLARRGNWVEVVTTDALDAQHRHPESGLTLMLDGIRVTYLRNLSNHLAYRQVFLTVGLREALRKLMCRCNVVHIHGHRHLLELCAAFMAEGAGLPCVLTPNGTLPNIESKLMLKTFYDLAAGDGTLNLVDLFVAVSEPERAWMLSHGISEERIELIPNGIETAEFVRLPPSGVFRRSYGIGKDKLVLYLGKITPRKGVAGLVRAFSMLRIPGCRLVIAGNDMGGAAEAKAEVKRLGLEQGVVFTGMLTGSQRLAALRDADVVVYPGRHEIFGLVPFEALLCGTPVVVASDSGCGQIIAAERIGTAVAPGDEAALAAAITEKLANHAGATAEAERGRKFISRYLDWKRISRLTETAYLRLLARR